MSVFPARPPEEPEAPDSRQAPRSRIRADEFAAGRVVSIDTDSVDEFNQYAAGWSVQYQMLDATGFQSRVSLVTTSSLQVALVQHAMGYSSQGENPAGALSMAMSVDGARTLTHRGRSVGSSEMALILSGEEYECVNRYAAPFFVVSLAREKMERYAADLWHESNLCGHSRDRLRFVDSTRRSRYLDACGRILRAVDEQPGVLLEQPAAAVLEETFLECLFLNARPVPPSTHERNRYDVARRAYRYLMDRTEEAPSVREMCAITGASYATLERGFRETYGMTPKVMMVALRLSSVRRALLHPSPTTTVTEVALRWGFVEFGRFSMQYRRRYGEVPSETLRRVRGEPQSAHTPSRHR